MGCPSDTPAAVGIGLVLRQLEVAHHRQGLRGECLIDLDHVDVIDRQPGPLRATRTAGTGPTPM
jgi:hypothetical protein